MDGFDLTSSIDLAARASSQLANAEAAHRRHLQREADRDDAVRQAAQLLTELNAKLDAERKERLEADDEARRYTTQWNKRSLFVARLALAVSVITIVVDIIFRFFSI